MMDARSLAELQRQQTAAGRPYLEFVRTDAMSVGLYVLDAGAIDGQSPHREDEVYVCSPAARVSLPVTRHAT